MTRMVYFSYPIDNANIEHYVPQLEAAKDIMLGNGVDVIYDPGDAFTISPTATPGDDVDWINRRAANAADGMFAFLPSGAQSIGVPIEIDRAMRSGKHVALCSDIKSWMLQDKRPGLGRFDISPEGMVAAALWLAGRPNLTEEPGDLPRPLPVVRLDEMAVLPQRRYHDDAGLDLVVSRPTEIPPGQSRDVPNGVAVELPYWAWGFVIGRSSTRRTKGLLVHPGVIDTGWRGELFTLVENLTDEPVKIEQGERLAQLILMQNNTRHYEPVEVSELSTHPRGTQGFGSTGR